MLTKKLLTGCILGMTVLMTSMTYASPGAQQHGHGQIPQVYNQHQGHRGIGIMFLLPRFHPMRHSHFNYRYPSHRHGAWYR